MTKRTPSTSAKSDTSNTNVDLCEIIEQYKQHNLTNSEKIKQTLKRLKQFSEK